MTLVEFDLEKTQEFERYSELDEVPVEDLWLSKTDLAEYRAEFIEDARGIIHQDEQEEEKEVQAREDDGKSPSQQTPKRDHYKNVFHQAFHHCQELVVGEESDSLDMSLRDALYHSFKKDDWNRVGLVTLTCAEVYREIQSRKRRMLDAVEEIQQRRKGLDEEITANQMNNHDDEADEMLRKACEQISYGPTVFARYLGWSTTKIVYKK